MKTLMEYFEDISAIPRVSGNEKAVADYIEAFAGAHGLACSRDGMHNLIITKPGSPGCEKMDAVMLQGHLDMVGAAADGVEHDFAKEPISLVRDGDILRARGTTLGADDGTAIAYMLALLADPALRHPPLECVFTAQEETGLFGAQAIDCSGLRAKTMLNLDAGPEGVFLVTCAGGCRVKICREMKAEPVKGKVWELCVSGLKSGHSGADMQRERANALVLAGWLLDALREQGARLVALSGGEKDNVIPASALALFAMEGNPEPIVDSMAGEMALAYAAAEPGLAIELRQGNGTEMLCAEDSDRAIDLLVQLPHGVQSLSAAMPGLIETSANFAAAGIDGKKLEMKLSLRSASNLRKARLLRSVKLTARSCGALVEVGSEYPGWAYQPDSPLRERCVRLYSEMFGKQPSVEGIHAGLECGVIKGKMPWLDIIAMGPAFGGMHTPEEWMSISSFERLLDYLKALLEEMAVEQ